MPGPAAGPVRRPPRAAASWCAPRGPPPGRRSCASPAPSGGGKTTLAKLIARALGRPGVLVALGGVWDESAVRGLPISFRSPQAGRVVLGLRKAKVRNPVMIPRRPERVAARRGRQPRRRGPPLDHRQHEPPIERAARHPPRRRVDGLEERRLRLLESRRLDVGVEGRRRPVVGRHVVALPAFSWSLNQPRLPCPK